MSSVQAHYREDAEKQTASLSLSQMRATALEQEIARKEEHLERTEQEIQALKLGVIDNTTEVCDFADHLIRLTTIISFF